MSTDEKGKDAFHYIVAVTVFFAIGLFQLIVRQLIFDLCELKTIIQCFFGLTLSERFLSLMKKKELVHPVPSNISVIINTTIQKTFGLFSE